MYFVLRTCVSLFVIVYGIAIYMYATRRNTYKQEVLRRAKPVPFKKYINRFHVVGAKRCDEPCLSSLYVIDRVVDTLNKFKKQPDKAFAYINTHFNEFASVEQATYPIVYERTIKNGKPTYITRVHRDRKLRNASGKQIYKALDPICSDGTCAKNMISRMKHTFNITSTDKVPYIIGESEWFSIRDKGKRVLKKSVYYRYSKHILIECGYTIQRQSENLFDIGTLILCYCIYALWIILAFVYPGILLKQCNDIRVTKRHTYHVVLLIVCILVPYVYLASRHLDAVRKRTDDSLVEVTTILVQARYSSLGMVSLVLALGLFIEFCPQERIYVFPALFLSMFFAVPALLDFYSEYSSIALKRRNHIRNACFIASIWSIVWLFTLLIYRSIVQYHMR